MCIETPAPDGISCVSGGSLHSSIACHKFHSKRQSCWHSRASEPSWCALSALSVWKSASGMSRWGRHDRGHCCGFVWRACWACAEEEIVSNNKTWKFSLTFKLNCLPQKHCSMTGVSCSVFMWFLSDSLRVKVESQKSHWICSRNSLATWVNMWVDKLHFRNEPWPQMSQKSTKKLLNFNGFLKKLNEKKLTIFRNLNRKFKF